MPFGRRRRKVRPPDQSEVEYLLENKGSRPDLDKELDRSKDSQDLNPDKGTESEPDRPKSIRSNPKGKK